MNRKIVFATNNAHKLKEIRDIICDKWQILSLSDIDCNVDIPETADTIEGNAKQKARFIKENFGYDCFADDTGLMVDALNGEPGVFSARYAGPDHDSEANMELLLKKLSGNDNRDARFVTVICLILDGEEHCFTGTVEGKITRERHGEKGFGYDPIFKPCESDKTFAEMTSEEKNRISHRGRATAKLLEHLSSCSKK